MNSQIVITFPTKFRTGFDNIQIHQQIHFDMKSFGKFSSTRCIRTNYKQFFLVS